MVHQPAFPSIWLLLCLPTPLTLVCGGGGPIFPLVVHQPAFPSIWLLLCLPTPLTLVWGGSPIFPLVVHQPAFPSIWLLLCLPTPLTLVCGGGESDLPACGPPTSFSIHLVVVVFTHSLDPCLWGGESDHPAFPSIGLLVCLPTPLTLVSGGNLIFPPVVHQPAFPSIWLLLCLPTPLTLVVGGVRSSRLWSTNQLFHPSGCCCAYPLP